MTKQPRFLPAGAAFAVCTAYAVLPWHWPSS